MAVAGKRVDHFTIGIVKYIKWYSTETQFKTIMLKFILNPNKILVYMYLLSVGEV